MKSIRAIRLMACALLAASLVVASAQAALSPNVTATQIRDFTRITFSWPQKVRFKVDEKNDGVTLTFSQPADINLDSIRSGLGARLRSSQISKDGASITLIFDQPYRIRHFISGNANGIDILGAQKAQPPAKPEPEPPVTQKPEAEPPPKVSPEPAKTEIPEVKEEPVASAPPPAAVEESAPADEPAVEVEKEKIAETPVTPDAEATDEPSGTTPEQESPAEPETAETEAEPAIQKEVPAEATVTAEEGDSPPEPVEIVANETAEPEVVEEVAQEDNTQALTDEFADAPATAEESSTENTSVAPPQEAETITPEETEPETVTQAEVLEQRNDAFDSLVGDNPELVQTPVTAQEISEDEDSDTPFIITSLAKATGTEIRFPWIPRTGAAVFFRDKTLWLVFSKKREINLPMLEGILPASVTSLSQIDHPSHTILTMETDGSLHAKVGQPKGSVEWWVTLSSYRQIPGSPILPEVHADARVPNIYLPVLEYSPPITITDPVVGDIITVTPFFRPGEGIYPTRDYAEMTVLESAQGLAVLRKSSDARVVPLRNGMRLTAQNGGLTLSTNMPALALEELESLGSQYATWFPYDQWKAEPGKLLETRRDLEHKLIGAGEIRGNSLRLKLAQTLLAEGLGYETLGMLEVIRSKNPGFYEDRQLAAMRGAANFLVDRYAEAIEDFNNPSLRDNKELKVWHEALAVLQKDRSRFDYLDHYTGFINKYPPKLREKLAIMAADNYINRRSYSKALKTFDTLGETGIDPTLMPYVDFLLGKISAESKQIETAKAIWEPLTQQYDDRFIRARAEFALTTLLYNNGDIDAKEAIRRLDQLRIVWRGDSLELSLLNYLGQLYINNDLYLDGLRTWRELVNNFPDSPLAGPVAREMAKTFNYLYAEDGADKLEPLQALATFYEFRQLTPVGTQGDEMIQGLADRLASVDLLDRAAALLEHQIQFRQEGEARSSMGAQLALIYLLNREPEKALEVLELTGYGENPANLKRKRTQLAAMALSETGEPQKALDMLAHDLSEDADILRLNIYWKTREWNRVVALAESLLGSRPDVTAPLTEEESEYLLQLSIAYMFERNAIQLQYLRNYFSPMMPDGPNKDIFLFVTDASGPIDPNRFDQVSQQISRIENFMQTYRNRVSEGGLSSAVN